MAIKTRQFAKIKENDILSISIGLATEKDVREWSHGEVTSAETINYKTYKPERYGLFDEVIFGPQTDYKCPICGTKYKRFNEGQICEKTDECKLYQPEILPAISRRTRMAHIQLASPIVHYWFFKIDNSIIAKALGLRTNKSTKIHSKTTIEDIIYFKSHIVLEDGGIKSLPKNEIIEINRAAIIYRNALIEIRGKYEPESEAYADITKAIDDLEATATSKIGKDYGIDFYELNEIIEEYSQARVGTGAKAIEYLLSALDVKAEIRRVKSQINRISKELVSTKIDQKSIEISKRYKRLEVLNAFANSAQDLKSLLIYSLPVIPADLRPLIQIDGGRHSTADINELYRRIIIRNNRLKKWIELEAPVLIIQNEQRMLQEAVDALIDNERRKPTPVLSKDGRPLKSIASSLIKGKKGLFIGNLLGKRVDYSGRSVIVVGPELKMHQAGIPRQMAARLFEPWIIKLLLKSKHAISIKSAKKFIEEQDNSIWPYVEEAIKGKIVLLNRAPTLHRLSIQAFEPVLIRGKAIRLHPLVTAAFNADFDGDQMAVHVPISPEAIREAREIMLANRNILGPKDGEPIINPSQDMILGLFYLTKEKKGAKGEGRFFGAYDEMLKAYENEHVELHARVALPISAANKQYLESATGYIVSTVGKFILNNAFPSNFAFVFDTTEASYKPDYRKYIAAPGTDLQKFVSELPLNKAFTKKDIAKIVRRLFDQYASVATKQDIAGVLATLNSSNASDTVMQYKELKDIEGAPLNKLHCQMLSQLTKDAFFNINKRITLMNQNVERVFEINERVELIEAVWFNYTNIVANSLDNIKELGFKFSMYSGTTISIDDIRRVATVDKKPLIKAAEEYTSDLKDAMLNKGLITDAERYRLVIAKWTKVKTDVRKNIEQVIAKEADNPLSLMMESGARGSISNLEQLAGMRGLMANNDKERAAKARLSKEFRPVIEEPVKSSFLEGLTSYEFYSSTHGARNGLTNTALGTGETGYLTHRLVDAAHHIIVKEDDCGSLIGTRVKAIVDTKISQVIIPLEDRIEGRFAAEAIYGKKGELLVNANEMITPDIAKAIVRENKIESVSIRSLFNCQTYNGVCKKCYGKDLSTNRIVQIGEAVGIVAAQSIGEPGTQLTMRTFQKGGVVAAAEGDYDRGGFQRLIQLVDATQRWEQKAEISRTRGRVISIENERIEDLLKSNPDVKVREQYTIVKVQSENNPKEIQTYRFKSNRRIRVKDGQDVMPGQKIVDGPIELDELLFLAGIGTVQQYLLKEIQRLYRLQGISISDKYVEIIVRQMLSKVQIKDPGHSSFFAGSLVDTHAYTIENRKLLAKGKLPAYGFPVILGVKEIPLLTDSFLAAASFQQTARVLVHASIRGQVDHLEGLKENIILGHKIPSGTGSPMVEARGKYDVRDPLEYFKIAKIN